MENSRGLPSRRNRLTGAALPEPSCRSEKNIEPDNTCFSKPNQEQILNFVFSRQRDFER
ncbi:MAG: hypothetical protein LBU34_15435 [Planctomycetaceae bacterium]|nr:hypothetical protein [Planctomycetaceae bacterium]